jgi:succinoglycan biosynthesis protein ExoO
MQPLVSVVIPAYNVAPWIGQAIDSVLNQTHQNLEILIIDDASTDDTAAVVASYSDLRLRLIRHPTNVGRGAVRNSGIREAKGGWIAMLDADDWFHPRRIEVLLDKAQALNVDLIVDDQFLIDGDSTRPWGRRFDGAALPKQPLLISIEKLLHKPILGVAKPFLRSSFINHYRLQYNNRYKHGQDLIFLLDCLFAGARSWYVPSANYFSRFRYGSAIWNSAVHSSEMIKVWSDLAQNPAISACPDRLALAQDGLAKTKENVRYSTVTEAVKSGQWRLALSAILKDPYFLCILPKRIPRMISTRTKRFVARLSGHST